MVGAVLVKDGMVVGEGFHAFAGSDHAELEALRAAETAAILRGDPRTGPAWVLLKLASGCRVPAHWHTANEWSFMLYGNARVTVLNPDGTVFIGDVSKGDLWFFPSGFPHSIQGLGPDGCEFLLVFDEGMFSEENTFLLSDWVEHVPPEVLSKNFGLGESAISKLPTHPLYIFPGQVPPSLEQDIAAAGGKAAMSPINYTFKMAAMPPTKVTPGGEARVVDSRNFPASKSIAAGLVRVKPGGMRELHWHPNANEWQFYISGKARMTVFAAQSDAHTMDFNEADVGFVPKSAGHYIENLGNTDLVFLEIFKTSEFQDVSLNNWLRHLPPEMVTAHLNFDAAEIHNLTPEARRPGIKNPLALMASLEAWLAGAIAPSVKVQAIIRYANHDVATSVTGIDPNREALVSDPPDIVREPLRPDEVHLYRSTSHAGNFLAGGSFPYPRSVILTP